MSEHTITAYEPRQYEIHLEYVDGEMKEVHHESERPPNWRAMSAYECSCGEEFRRRDQAEAHLEP